jgi:hypothetical protein
LRAGGAYAQLWNTWRQDSSEAAPKTNGGSHAPDGA